MSKWFPANKLSLNQDKINAINFIKNSPQYPLHIWYNDKYTEEAVNTKFLRLQIDNHLNWKNHTDQLVPKLSAAQYAVISLLHINNTHTLKSTYFAYFHSLMKYGIIFWGNSPYSKKVFTLQKKIVRVMMCVKSRNSCRDLFKRLEVLTLPREYILWHTNLLLGTWPWDTQIYNSCY
jgi:hypothetical protein